MTAAQVQSDAYSVVRFLVTSGLSNDENYPYLDRVGNTELITFNTASGLSVALKARSYKEIYDEMHSSRTYNAMLADGGLLQMNYEFERGTLVRHRLAYWPSPYLSSFQDDPDLYLLDEIYAEVVSKAIVPFPLRFDFDSSPGVTKPLVHPMSHVTLGQYDRCRIPASSAVGPIVFSEFILRSFYNTFATKYSDKLIRPKYGFAKCIHKDELKVMHFATP